MDSSVGLAIQCVGLVLVTLLFLFLRGSIRSPSLNYWAAAWASMSLALLSLLLGFHISSAQKPFYSLYFFGEYAFGLMFAAGCRHHAAGKSPNRLHLYLLIPAILIAIFLPHLSEDFNDLFMVQATIMAGLFAASFVALRPLQVRKETTPGLRVMLVALLLLTLDFLHYVPAFGARKGFWGITVPLGYLQYTSIFDLILEILLGFGTVMVLMEGVRCEVEAANRKLIEARDRLALLAQMDPLTEALNRHAFHSLLSGGESDSEADTSGCLAVIDMDNLKTINDTLGHSVGDKAIRAVARAVRSLIRADDMVFRWGGDEFLVLMFRLQEAEASRRMQTLNEILEKNALQWTSVAVRVSVSFGLAGFASMTQIGSAIEQADKAMYRRRQEARRTLSEMRVS